MLKHADGYDMEFVKLEKIKDGKYLKNYELTYLNKSGNEKKYEIVSRKELSSMDDVGKVPSGVSIIATKDNKMLLLKEFRMSLNKVIFNLCAGMIDDNETIEDCIARELYEETGLSVGTITRILPPSFSAVGISDISTYIAFVEATGDFSDHTSDNEQISSSFYSKEEISILLETEEFSSRSQLAAYFFSNSIF